MAGCITSCSAGGYGPSTRNPLPPHRGCHQSGFPGWCNSARSQPFIRFWGTEITYIPLRKGFLYLVAIMDMFSKDVLSGKISNSWDTQFCMDALEMASGLVGLEEGAASTISCLKDSGVRSSTRRFICVSTLMDGMIYGHVRPHSSLGGKTPHEVFSCIETRSSSPGLTMSRGKSVQQKAPTSICSSLRGMPSERLATFSPT